MTSVIIVDDERAARQLIRAYLGGFPNYRILDEASDGKQAVDLINRLNPDLVFLDVQMPGLNGFEVLKELTEIPQIVFSTAYDSYALQAFDVHALDYLLKPYAKIRFEAALQRVELWGGINKAGPFAESLLFETSPFPERILVNKNRRLIAVEVTDIAYIEAYGDYSKIHTIDQTFVSSSGISALEMKFDPKLFLRVHRSTIVNISKVAAFVKAGKTYEARLKSGKLLQVSRGYAHKIKEILI